MRIILIGCEYSGTTTIAGAMDDWLEKNMGARFPLIHDHWKIPHTTGHPPNATDEEQAQVLSLSPVLKEMTQRHSLYYHIQPNSWNSPDYMAIGMHIDDAVYGPLYYGYGGEGQPHDRRIVGQQVESSMLKMAPDVVLVQLKAPPAVISERMQANTHHNSLLESKDIEYVIGRFQEEFERSSIQHKITLDTSSSGVEQTMADFSKKIEPHLTEVDRSRILTHALWKKR